jgi:molecular chaperone Hsp33
MSEIVTPTHEEGLFESDSLQRFIFDNAPVRGEWVHLSKTWQDVLERRTYPVAVQRLLGEMMAAAALLTATVKIKGRLVLQIKSTGPVTLAMVECTSNNTLRALAQWDGEIADDAALNAITGEGSLAITIEVEGAKQPYQGVVSIQGKSLASVLEVYFKQSEQLDTQIWLGADDKAAAGLFLQQLPSEEINRDEDEENWSRISHLASTVTTAELLSLGAGTLLFRLFHEEECRLLAQSDLEFACSCSRERVSETISLLGQSDAEALLEEQGQIEIACEFCNEHYHFDEVDVAHIFTDVTPNISGSDTLH